MKHLRLKITRVFTANKNMFNINYQYNTSKFYSNDLLVKYEQFFIGSAPVVVFFLTITHLVAATQIFYPKNQKPPFKQLVIFFCTPRNKIVENVNLQVSRIIRHDSTLLHSNTFYNRGGIAQRQHSHSITRLPWVRILAQLRFI